MVGSLREDFRKKMKVTEDHRQERSTQNNYHHKDQLLNHENPRLPPVVRDQEEEEFSFVCANPSGPLISAEDIFQNGMIRPIYTLCNRDDLLFAEDVRIKAKININPINSVNVHGRAQRNGRTVLRVVRGAHGITKSTDMQEERLHKVFKAKENTRICSSKLQTAWQRSLHPL
jgi:hypothetical protein